MEHVYWLRDGKVAGRSGPNHNPWDLEELKSNGFAAILSVNHGDDVHESLLHSLGIEYAAIPMSSNAPIREGDREFCLQNLPRAMSFIRENLPCGPVLVHCRSGKDRTGMVLAAYLIEFEGFGVREAMNQVLEVRPIAYSAEGWREFALEVLSHYESSIQPGPG